MLISAVYQFFIKSIEIKVYKSSRSFPIIPSTIHLFLLIYQPVRWHAQSYLRISGGLHDLWHLPSHVTEFWIMGCEKCCDQHVHDHLKNEADCPGLPLFSLSTRLARGLGSDPDMDNHHPEGWRSHRWKAPGCLNDCHQHSLPHKPELITFGLLCEKK